MNYRDAFELVAGDLTSGSAVTEMLTREIHRRLVQGVRGDEGRPGEYRRIQNVVASSQTGQVIYTPPAAEDVPELMKQMVDWLNRETDIHPVLVAALAQFQLVHIHPFVDGNGRTSRLLSTLCLYCTGYDFKRLFTISEYYDRDRRAVYDAIQGVRDNGLDHTGWLEFYCRGLATQMQETVDRGTRAIRADVLATEHKLNERQTQALQYLMENASISISAMESLFPDINRRTLQRDLKKMTELGLLEDSTASSTDPNRQYRLREL